MSEHSDSPTRNSIASIFNMKTTRDRRARDSVSSLTPGVDNGDSRSSLRRSVEGTIDKIKERLEGDEDGENGKEEQHGIMKLAPKTLGSRRRRKKQEKEDSQRASDEADRGRSIADRGTLENDANSFGYSSGDRGSRSSLITYDEPENDSGRHTETPSLSTRSSYTGYCTTNSPVIKTATIPHSSLSEVQLASATPRASSFPPQADNLATSKSTPTLLTSSETLRAPTNGSQKRSPSPVGRLREALKPKRSGSPGSSPERKEGTEGVASKEKSRANDSRRGSVAARIGSIFPDRPSSQPTSIPSSPERPRTVASIETNVAPQTPPPGEVAPVIVNTPPTPTDTSTPRFSSSRDRGSSEPVTATTNSNVITSPSGNMISHRRARSGSANLGPSKLSNITSAPLTPTPENSIPGSSPQTGFFSTVFSAAQNAANTLSNTITNAPGTPSANKSRVGAPTEVNDVESPTVETLADKPDSEILTEEKEPAVNTLGMGDLSLSHLGISEASSGANTPTGSRFPDEARGRSESTNDDSLPNRAKFGPPISTSDTIESGSTATIDDSQTLIRPRSVYDPSVSGDQTPPNGSLFEGKAGIHRSGSIRSAIGNRRNRGSSAATGNTIGAAIASANSSLANPQAQGSSAKITGFAVASKKRNRDFHQLFRSVPDDDYLIEDYSCALQKEILAHGRLYVSEGHLCFSSNIFGWVTTLVMSFDEIVSVEKRSTALLFKNGLMVSTLHAKNVFASFTSRDSTYDLIIGIWKLGHPSLRSSLNGVRIDGDGGGDKTEKYDGKDVASQSGSESGSDEEEGEDVYDEDDDEDGMSFEQEEGSVDHSDIVEKVISTKPSTSLMNGSGTATEKKEEASPVKPVGDFPGPATHAPTECSDQDSHYSKIIADEVIPAPLGKIYSMVFGPTSLSWMKNFMTVDQKCLELTFESETTLSQENKSRVFSFIKPLNGSIGPKQTKCISTETLDSIDLEKAVSITVSTQTPDVPSGNVFSTKTRYCLTWAEGNATRLQMNFSIEWTGKSWLKTPIEKGSNDGQVKYAKDIVAALKAAVSTRRPNAVPSGKGKKKGRKGKESKNVGKTTDGTSDSKPTTEDWGLFEPLHGLLGPIVDILQTLLTGNVLYGLLVGLLVASWFRSGFTGMGGSGRDMAFLGSPERLAAYEEIWIREESELWDWLEERVGMDRIRDVGRMPIEKRTVNDRLKDEKMEEREVDAAIKVTEEKLNVLKDTVEKKKSEGKLKSKTVDFAEDTSSN